MHKYTHAQACCLCSTVTVTTGKMPQIWQIVAVFGVFVLAAVHHPSKAWGVNLVKNYTGLVSILSVVCLIDNKVSWCLCTCACALLIQVGRRAPLAYTVYHLHYFLCLLRPLFLPLVASSLKCSCAQWAASLMDQDWRIKAVADSELCGCLPGWVYLYMKSTSGTLAAGFLHLICQIGSVGSFETSSSTVDFF